MKSKLNRKTLFTIVGGAVLINPAFAQQQATEELEEIVVTGLRGSLMQSMDIKRDAIGVVDAISAEDIGKFPNTNVAESLQRIPGVSIDRQNGEGSQVTVRGFGPGFNLVTLNGRTVPTAEVNVWGNRDNFAGGQGRSFDFSNIAAEAVTSLEVYKTGQALLPSGGIGATINVKTHRPFDNPGLQATIGAKGLIDTSVEAGDDVTPEVSGLFSWTNDAENVGISVFGGYSKRDSGAAIGQTNDWVVRRAGDFFSDTSVVRAGGDPANYVNAPAAGELFAIPQDSRYDISDLSRERLNGQLVVQFRPMDSLTLTADYTYFKNENEELRYEQTNWFATPFDQIIFDGQGPVSQALFMQENNDGTKDMGFEQTYRAQKDEFDSVGFNAEWAVTDNGTLRFDAHFDKAKSIPNNPLGHSATFVSIAAPVIAQHSLDWRNGDGFPIQSYTINDSIKGNGDGILNVQDLGSQVSRSSAQWQEMEVDEFDLRYSVAFENSRLDFGVNRRDTEVYVRGRTTEQDLGTWGVSNPGDIELYAPGVIQAFCMSCRFDDFPVGQAQTAFRGDATKLFSILTPIYEAQGNSVRVADNENWVEEDITAFYTQFQVETDFLGLPAQVTGGLRYERTKVNSTALQSVPVNIVWTADNDFAIEYSGLQDVEGKGEYNHLLPNIDFKVDLTDSVVARMSYSQTIGRVPYGDLFASTTAGQPNNPTVLGGQTGGNARNPGLLPLESENWDVSLEWYYKNDSYVSVGFFDKTVKNFLGTGVFSRPLFGLRDPTSGAPGSRSGIALEQIDDLGIDRSPANLFTMVALMDAHGGNVAAARAEFETGLTAEGVLRQEFVDLILGLYDVRPDANDPEMVFRVTQPINDREGNIFGWEFAAQHFFGDSGFGLAGSYTVVNGDVKADIGQDPDENQFALVGLSDTANVTLMYENHGISARLAYNWRDKFLNATNQGGSRSPQFTKDYGQFDLSVSYDVNDNFQVMLEGINLTGEDHREYRRKDGMTVWAYELGPRYAIGARYKF